MRDSKTLLIAAGGTGGHIYPALATANILHDDGVQIVWLGAKTPVEKRILANSPWTYQSLVASGYRGKSFLGKLQALLNVGRGVWQAIQYCRRYKPKAVFVTGGYVSLGAGLAAKLLGIPLLVSEQNAVAGTVNKLLGPLAKAVFTAYPDVFPKRTKPCCVGIQFGKTLSMLPGHDKSAPHKEMRVCSQLWL